MDWVMFKTLKSPTIALSLLMVGMTGCGRKGDLDLPSTPVDQQNKRDSKVAPVADKPFLLDPLL
mgnify:CR=1 FL=1